MKSFERGHAATETDMCSSDEMEKKVKETVGRRTGRKVRWIKCRRIKYERRKRRALVIKTKRKLSEQEKNEM
jgi:hypothetical protein